MKTLFLLPILLLSLISCSSETEIIDLTEINLDELVERGGVYYEKFSDIPFTGKVSGIKQGEMKNGKREGKWFEYYWTNGQLYEKGSYKNGKKEGEWVRYYENGSLSRKENYRNGLQEGERVGYHENGRLFSKGSYKNGKREGAWVYYFSNGQLSQKGIAKNGKKEGEWIAYHDNGTVKEEWAGTFKNGEKVSEKK